MATVTTSSVDNGQLRNWNVPGASRLRNSIIPRGEVVFAGSDTIPALDALDESNFTLQCNFPRNFWYRLVPEIWVNTFAASGTGGVADPNGAMRVILSSDALGFTDFTFLLHNEDFFVNDAGAFELSGIGVTGVANRVVRPFKPLSGVPSDLIDAQSDAARLFLNWVDVSTDDTAAILVQWRIRALQYDADQVREYPVHTPQPVIAL